MYSSQRVFFYVQKNTVFTKENAVIPFEKAQLNMGDAMDLKSGTFTAPKSGVYHFSFSAIKDSNSEALVVYLRKNRVKIAKAFGENKPYSDSHTAALVSTLQLKGGDVIDLFKTTGKLHENEKSSQTHFTGWMVEEDLELLYIHFILLMDYIIFIKAIIIN